MDNDSESSACSCFVLIGTAGKYICCAKSTVEELKKLVAEDKRIDCLEVFDYVSQMQMQPTPDGGISFGKFHLASRIGSTLASITVSMPTQGSIVYFIDEMEELEAENHMNLVKNARELAKTAHHEHIQQKGNIIIPAGGLPSARRHF